MATENQPHADVDVHDVFDVSSTAPVEPVEPVDLEIDLSETADAPPQAGVSAIATPPAAEPPLTASSLSVGQPSRPLLGRLPLRRVIPQDVHSVMDYLDGGGVMAGALLSRCPKAKAASVLMGATTIAASSMTDYKLSLAKVVPIEAHEAVDYVFGLSAIAAPFVLGYRKTAPHVAAMHVAIGIGTIVASLLTDYRAYRGIGRRAAA
jgi:hypothetical protein